MHGARNVKLSSRQYVAFGAAALLLASLAIWVLVVRPAQTYDTDARVVERSKEVPDSGSKPSSSGIATQLSLEGLKQAPRQGADSSIRIDLASATEYRALLADANGGDAVAATRLYLMLQNCEKIQAGTPSLESLRRDEAAQVDVEATLLQRAAELEHCASIDKKIIAERASWLGMAAEAGLLQAQLIYAVQAEELLGGAQGMLQNPESVQRHRANAMRYLDSAASTGNIDAILVLSDVYQGGVLTPRDPVAAYGLRLASLTVSPGWADPRVVAQWGRDLTPAQRSAAENYSREFIRQIRS